MRNDMAPVLKVQSAMLEQKRDQFKAQGFDYFLEAEAAKAQNPGNDAKAKTALATEVERLNAMSANAYAAAKRLQAILDELPTVETKEVEGDA